jgi:hypothetical protein
LLRIFDMADGVQDVGTQTIELISIYGILDLQ